MAVVPPNRSSTGWPRGVNQFGNKYISAPAKPLTLERTINLYALFGLSSSRVEFVVSYGFWPLLSFPSFSTSAVGVSVNNSIAEYS